MGTIKTLIVTFEHHSDLSAYSSGIPIGWQLAQEKGWSHLCVVSEHQDWFRDPHVIRHFDRLIDDGFLDQFDDVIFYGCYAGGYAAAAYSVSYPMATVIAINPQATLNPASHRGTNGSNTHGDRISQHDLDMPQKCAKAPRCFCLL